MSNRASSSVDRLQLASLRQENADPETVGGDAAATIRRWTREFPMSDHLELGGTAASRSLALGDWPN